MKKLTTTFTIDKNHPSLPGHFPGNALVPAVVLLTHIEAAMKQLDPSYVWTKVAKAKFESVAPIDEPICLEVEVSDSSARFVCTENLGNEDNTEPRQIVSGRVILTC